MTAEPGVNTTPGISDAKREECDEPKQPDIKLRILNKGSGNINNTIANKVYADKGRGAAFSFEEHEFVVVSTNNQLFEEQPAGRLI